ncbi:LysM peptidoglycan-binding domain-containing protein [Cohnella suwonensis]|uniref:LysM peptidoglycan-binding domain-containing protein n=1 Tax=Cohnella suwonensis TaxID=696072 RepID=A0ABW0LR78_9BACL
MTDQRNGLRFDIYERVQLPDDAAAIEELEEIELVPHMRALPQNDQVLLKGHLLLSGVYKAQDAGEASQLEHWIPVEISLPLDRIQSVEELAVEIDNFDVDLVSNRSLNVTGVLALRGLQVQTPQSPVWRDDSFTVVHQAEPEGADQERPAYESYGNEAASSPSAEAGNFELSEQDREEDWGLQAEVDQATSDPAAENGWLSMFQHLEEARQPAVLQPESPAQQQQPVQQPQSQQQSQPRQSPYGDVTAERLSDAGFLQPEPQRYEEPTAPAEEKADLRVALGGKALDSSAQQSQQAQQAQSGVGLLSQLGDKGAKREAELRLQEAAIAEEKALAAKNNPQSSGDELEWTRLFLNAGAQAQSFRKVRMCIVQREDTLDAIASRYHVQARELQLYNRLHEPYLSEGQVLYIP